MSNFIKNNFLNFDSVILLSIITTFFLPTLGWSIRFEHFALYLFSIFIFIKYFFDKNFYKDLFNSFNILFIFSVILFALAILTSIIINFFSEEFSIINEKFNFLSFFSVTDNFLQPFCIIFISLFFLKGKNSLQIINVFLFTIIVFASLNGLYAFFEILIFNLDKSCGVIYSNSQSFLCKIIIDVDKIYSGELFSFALDKRVLSPDQLEVYKNLLANDTSGIDANKFLYDVFSQFNSGSIGWLSLSSGRSAGIFSMPIQACVFQSSVLFIIIYFFYLNKEEINKSFGFELFILVCFNFVLLGALVSVSKLFSHVTLLLLLINFFLLRKIIKIRFKIILINIFIISMFFYGLYQIKWMGYNIYLGHIKRHVLVISDSFNNKLSSNLLNFNFFEDTTPIGSNEKTLKRKFEKNFEEFKTRRTANYAFRPYDITKTFIRSKELQKILTNELLIFKHEFDYDDNYLKRVLTPEQYVAYQELYEGDSSGEDARQFLYDFFSDVNMSSDEYAIVSFDNKENNNLKIEELFNEKFYFYLNVLTGGRYGYFPLEIKFLMKISPLFGFGPFYSVGYDQTIYYLLFSLGLFGLIAFIIFLLVIFAKICSGFSNKKVQSLILFSIFLLFFVASLGAPVYFMNRVIIIFYFLITMLFFQKSEKL